MRRFIWESDVWPGFEWDERALISHLFAAAEARGILAGALRSAGFAEQQLTELAAVTDEALKTSEIEGDRLDPAATRSSVARHLGIDIGGSRPPDRKVDGVVDMLVDATQNFQAPLSDERLFYWHRGLLTGSEARWVGRFRTAVDGEEQVVEGPYGRRRVLYVAPPGERVATEMSAFLEWFNGRTLPSNEIVAAGLAHLWFVTIHPFVDGNGRIARAIGDLASARGERSGHRFFSLSAQIRSERDDYYAMLQRTQQSQSMDVTPWLQWFAGCYTRAIGSSLRVVDEVMLRGRFWARNVHVTFNARQRAMIGRLLGDFEGNLTTKKWAKLGKVSEDTANRDINDLVRAGILCKRGAARSTHFVLAESSAGSGAAPA
jgi:Fic family protein